MLFNQSSGGGPALGLSWQVSTPRKVLVILLALLLAFTLVFAVMGSGMDGTAANADGDTSTVAAVWSYNGYGGNGSGGGYFGGHFGSFRSGPSWS